HTVGRVDVKVAAPGVSQLGVGELPLPERVIFTVDLCVDMLHRDRAAEIGTCGFEDAVMPEDILDRCKRLRVRRARAPIDIVVEFPLVEGNARAALVEFCEAGAGDSTNTFDFAGRQG